jgi:hypothetical protein
LVYAADSNYADAIPSFEAALRLDPEMMEARRKLKKAEFWNKVRGYLGGWKNLFAR